MTTNLQITRRRALAAGLLAGGGALCAGVTLAQNRDLVLEAAIGGEPITLRSDRRFAGAISSMRFRDCEYVDAADHGRLFQGAIQFDGLGECHNPTLAGASRDRRRSTSRLLESDIGDGVWETTTQTAFWHRPDDRCTTLQGVRRRPANRRALAEVLYTWRHRFGVMPVANAVETDVTVTLVRPERQVVVEALTLYTPPTFDSFHAVRGGRLVADDDVDASPGERPEPRILSTADGATPLPSSPASAAGHGRWRFPTTSKLNLVFRPRGGLDAGHHRFRCAWAIGTRAEVAAALSRL